MWRLLIALLAVAPTCHATSLPLRVQPSEWLETISQDLKANGDAALSLSAAPITRPIGAPLINNRLHRLIVPLQVGSPPQSFNVILDPHSSLLWLVDRSCDATPHCANYCYSTAFCDLVCPEVCCESKSPFEEAVPAAKDQCGETHRFSSNESTSFQEAGAEWIGYHDGSIAYGFSGADQVVLGSAADATHSLLTLPAAEFGLANQVNGSLFLRDPTVGGVLGLNKANREYAGPTSILEQAYRAGTLKRWNYTIYTDPDGRNGAITIGAQYPKCQQSDAWTTTNKAWQFPVTATQVNKGDFIRTPHTAVLDTSEPMLVVSNGVMGLITKVTNAAYNAKYKAWFVKCDTKLTWTAVMNQNVQLTENELVKEVAPSKCVLQVRATAKTDAAEFVFGAPVLHRYCASYDVPNSKIQLNYKLA